MVNLDRESRAPTQLAAPRLRQPHTAMPVLGVSAAGTMVALPGLTRVNTGLRCSAGTRHTPRRQLRSRSIPLLGAMMVPTCVRVLPGALIISDPIGRAARLQAMTAMILHPRMLLLIRFLVLVVSLRRLQRFLFVKEIMLTMCGECL